MNISIIGAGYVGLVTGLCMAERGHRVICIDTDASRIADLTRGVLPIPTNPGWRICSGGTCRSAFSRRRIQPPRSATPS